MAKKTKNTSPKKRNRHSDQGVLLPGVLEVRTLRKRLMKAQKEGAPAEELEKLRAELKAKKGAGKEKAS
jgi:hypothetical protein